MQDWVLTRLAEFVGRSDRKKLGPHTRNRLVAQSMGRHKSYRVARKATCLGQGLVVTEAGVIPDYPGIRRVYHLTNAITKYYYSPFYLETEVPGYHVRVAWREGSEVAFTRDGRYCAFSSDRASEFIPRAFFKEHPPGEIGKTGATTGVVLLDELLKRATAGFLLITGLAR